ncbi:MAG TPA: SDR family oxidoreductase [Spirochaetia bacterium]|nr:SDR family oxidoreductase [Spirochaetia bacterium]
MRWVLVTGATSGIGKACARRLAEAGYGVIACGRRPQALRAIEAEAARDHLMLVPLSLDVTDPGEIHNAVEKTEIITSGQGIDVLVNNAGYGQTGFLLELSGEQLRHQFDVNFFSVLEMTKALLPQLERNRGTVINMGSILSRLSVPWVGLYGTVKNALHMITDVLRVELHGAGIRVVLVEPGAIKTPFFDTAIASQGVGDQPEASSPTPFPPGGRLAVLYTRARLRLSQVAYRPFLLFPPIQVDRVADLVVRIVRRRSRRRQYVVPLGAGALLSLLKLIPRPLLDHFKRRAFYLN